MDHAMREAIEFATSINDPEELARHQARRQEYNNHHNDRNERSAYLGYSDDGSCSSDGTDSKLSRNNMRHAFGDLSKDQGSMSMHGLRPAMPPVPASRAPVVKKKRPAHLNRAAAIRPRESADVPPVKNPSSSSSSSSATTAKKRSPGQVSHAAKRLAVKPTLIDDLALVLGADGDSLASGHGLDDYDDDESEDVAVPNVRFVDAEARDDDDDEQESAADSIAGSDQREVQQDDARVVMPFPVFPPPAFGMPNSGGEFVAADEIRYLAYHYPDQMHLSGPEHCFCCRHMPGGKAPPVARRGLEIFTQILQTADSGASRVRLAETIYNMYESSIRIEGNMARRADEEPFKPWSVVSAFYHFFSHLHHRANAAESLARRVFALEDALYVVINYELKREAYDYTGRLIQSIDMKGILKMKELVKMLKAEYRAEPGKKTGFGGGVPTVPTDRMSAIMQGPERLYGETPSGQL